MNINQKDIGLKIKEARKAAGMTQEELARLLRFNGNEKISKMENGKVNNVCDLNVLSEIAGALGTTIYHLIDEKGRNSENISYMESFYKKCIDEHPEFINEYPCGIDKYYSYYEISENKDLYLVTKNKTDDSLIEKKHIVNDNIIYRNKKNFHKRKDRHRFKHRDFLFDIKIYNANDLNDEKIKINFIDIKIIKEKTLIGRYRGWHMPAGEYRNSFFEILTYLDCQDSILPDMWIVIDEYARKKDEFDIILSRDLYIKKEYQDFNLHNFIRKDIYRIIQEEYIECACLNSFEEKYETLGNIDLIDKIAIKYDYDIVKDFDNDTTNCIFGLYYSFSSLSKKSNKR